jgi:hypothetical protein
MPEFTTPQPIALTVELPVGELRLAAGERDTTTVEVQPVDPGLRADVAAAEGTRVELSDTRLLVKVPRSRRPLSPFSRGGAVLIEIALPAGSRVVAQLAAAGAHGAGRLGECRVTVGAGDIELEHTGPAELVTGAGAVRVGRVDGPLTVRTGTGRVSAGCVGGDVSVKNSNGVVELGTVAGEARIRSANGDIAVDRAAGAVDAKTANGAVRIGAAGAGAVAQTACGGIEVGIPEGVRAWLEVSTHFGRVRNELEGAPPPGAGEPTAEVRAQTAFGDITIRRAPAVAVEAPA